MEKAEHSFTEGLIKTACMERRYNKEDLKLDFLRIERDKEKERERNKLRVRDKKRILRPVKSCFNTFEYVKLIPCKKLKY